MDKNITIQILIGANKGGGLGAPDLPIRFTTQMNSRWELDTLEHIIGKRRALFTKIEAYFNGWWQPLSLPAWEVKTVVVTLTLEVPSTNVASDIINSVAAPEDGFIADVQDFFNESYGEGAVSITAIDADIV